MSTRSVLAYLLLATASVLALSQVYALFTMPAHPMLPDFRSDYLIQSSIENFGFAIPAIAIGVFLLRSRARLWLWFALFIAGIGLWQFVIHELWLHFYELPHLSPHYAQVQQPYFTGPLSWVLIRLSWHITLPASFILAVLLLLSPAPAETPQPTGTAPVGLTIL
jgi:hypothetical protein